MKIKNKSKAKAYIIELKGKIEIGKELIERFEWKEYRDNPLLFKDCALFEGQLYIMKILLFLLEEGINDK